MKHVIIVGDSFSDENRGEMPFNYSEIKNPTLQNLLVGWTLKNGILLSLDIINQGKENEIILHFLAKGSAGNHYISEKLFKKVTEIRGKDPDSKIYAIIQLSAFFRNGKNLKNNIKEIDIEKYPYDYYREYMNFSDLSINYHKHLDNIENIEEFCSKNKVQKIIFFGWSSMYDEDVQTFKLHERIEKIKNIVRFFPYDDIYDEMRSYCSGKKIIKQELGNKLYLVKSNYFGGMADFVRKIVPVGERYSTVFDPHLSSRSNYVFYKSVVLPWIVKEELIENKELPEEIKRTVDFIFRMEKIRYDIFSEASQEDYDSIRELSRVLNMQNIRDLSEYEDKFSKLAFKIKQEKKSDLRII